MKRRRVSGFSAMVSLLGVLLFSSYHNGKGADASPPSVAPGFSSSSHIRPTASPSDTDREEEEEEEKPIILLDSWERRRERKEIRRQRRRRTEESEDYSDEDDDDFKQSEEKSGKRRRRWKTESEEAKEEHTDEEYSGQTSTEEEEESRQQKRRFGSSKFSTLAESVRGGGDSDSSASIDDFAGSLVTALGWLVSFQSLAMLLSSNEAGRLAHELASVLLSRETLEAMKTIRTILEDFHNAHGVVDVFTKYRMDTILMAVYALNRLQHSALVYERRLIATKTQPKGGANIIASTVHTNSTTDSSNKALLDELAHYAVFANAAYGWKMDLATRWRLHMGGNAQALLRRTGVEPEDILVAKWESSTHRPAYFCVRDRSRQTIVLCVRGTWSAGDLLTDLCCTAQEFDHSSSPLPNNLTKTARLSSAIYYKADGLYERATKRRRVGHHGMLEAARALQKDAEELLERELGANPDYSLVLVGHSMGGGVVSLLSTLLERKFPNLRVYTYGSACVSPATAKLHKNIVSVVIDGDPFCCLSLGHVADISTALDCLCDDPLLRNDILMRTNDDDDNYDYDDDDNDLKWCYETMEKLREKMNADKLYPPGRIMLLSGASLSLPVPLLRPLRILNNNYVHQELSLREVSPLYFRDLVVGPKAFDLSRHLPSLYESTLRALAESQT